MTGTRRESDASGNGGVRAEFDSLGNEIALTDPQPPESTNYDYVGNYDGGGNAYDAATGCAVDGQQMPCYLVMRAYNQGKPGGLGGGGGVASFSHVWVDEWEDWNIEADLNVFEDGGTTGSRNVGYFLTIQNQPGISTPQNNGGLDLDKLKNNVKTLLGDPDCAGYVKALIKQAEENTRNNPPEFPAPYPYNPAEFTNSLDRFDEFKFTLGKTGGLGGTTSGNLRERSATVHLVDLRDVSSWKGQPAAEIERATALIALHEMIHLAGTNNSLGYGDFALAIATSRLPDAPDLLVDPNEKYAQGKYSKYWNDELNLHCNFNRK